MDIKLLIVKSLALFCFLGHAAVGQSHFGAIVPSDDIITQDDSRKLSLEVKFFHPMEQNYMDLTKPRQFGVMRGGKKTNLLQTLQEAKTKGAEQDTAYTFWKTEYRVTRPGDYTFFLEPQPYWEAAENSFIVHYTKVCINALGLEKGWDEPIGFETEIIPLTRPYGLWTNNLFTGQVLLNGSPVPYAPVEVEYLNESTDNLPLVIPPGDPYITQVVKADSDGIFSYAMPRSGWWGFAALSIAERKLKHEGLEKEVEIGAVYWVHTVDMK